MNTNHSLTVSMQAILTQTWVVVGKVKVGGDGGRRADGTAERTWWKGRWKGEQRMVGKGAEGGRGVGGGREATPPHNKYVLSQIFAIVFTLSSVIFG